MASKHRSRVGDTRTLLLATLLQNNAEGVAAAVDLTGYTVTFKMINAATGATKRAATAVGVSINNTVSGKVSYQFAAGDVDTAGIFWGTFVITAASKTDHFPAMHDALEVHFSSDTISAQAAYEASL